ncbi:hypothetical protein DV515_00014208 [Chloebia gouldiae]|uniref:Glycylpeptide N-tetradecanoyltransferase n=1 Tax=Chloebia gouldiae TaxID=44316 RepID=A0A3L8S079_CHLGU|nr:hypothetical protein DV515_00014208 [Chloebia gouldiae]
MQHKDIPAVHKLLTEYLKQFHLTPVMSREEVEHWFVPQENIIDTFVVEVRGRSRMGEVFSWAFASTGAVGMIRGRSSMPLQDGKVLEALSLPAAITPTGRAPLRLWPGFVPA